MPPVTLPTLLAPGVAGAQARGLFFRWTIGQLCVEAAIFEFAVEQYRAAPSPAKLHALHAFATQGHGVIAAVNVPAAMLVAANNWVAAHPPGAPGFVPAAPPGIFDAAQNDQDANIFPGLLGNYDDAYNMAAPGIVNQVNLQTNDLRALALAFRNAGFNSADMGFIPPYH